MIDLCLIKAERKTEDQCPYFPEFISDGGREGTTGQVPLCLPLRLLYLWDTVQ